MATATDNGGSATLESPEAPQADNTAERLTTIENDMRNQGVALQRTARGFGIFAVFALLIAAANLLIVATKLDSKSNSSGASAPTAAAAATPTRATAPATAVAGRVGVSLKEFKIIPTASQAAAGRVTFNVRNDGTVPHEFVVLRTNRSAGSLLNGARADETGNVGETGDLQPGAAKTIALTLKAGHYALICNLPGHYRAGQHTDFTVK